MLYVFLQPGTFTHHVILNPVVRWGKVNVLRKNFKLQIRNLMKSTIS